MSTDELIGTHILDLIHQLEATHKVKVLFAVESGSREWGFASVDSDHDVRAVHYGSPEAYLGLFQPRDQIDLFTQVEGLDLEVVSWDLKKFAGLFLKSNPAVSEWLQSEQVYVESPYRAELKALYEAGFSPCALKKHYVSLARKNYEKYVRDKEDVNLKRYIYVLRALGCLHFLQTHNQRMPPLNYQRVIDYLPEKVGEYLEHLITQKRASESLSGKCSEAANNFIEAHFTMKFEKAGANFDVEALDRLIIEIIRGY